MRIVPQSASASYCPLLALPAPQIAGLLPAHVESSSTLKPQITIDKPRQSLLDRQRAIWDAQDAELEAFIRGAHSRLAAVYVEVMAERPTYIPRPFFCEVAP